MTRNELLKELSNYKVVPEHKFDLENKTDNELKKLLNIYKVMFEDYFEAE